MRDFKGMKRQRGRNRKPGGGGGNANAANPNRSWDSQGPENIKVRGNAQTVYERYQQLARDAASSGDRVLGENYLQHAEHYFRVLRALQPQRPVSEIAARELSNQGYDIDFEDETGAQAAAFMAAQAAADRAANPQGDAGSGDGGQGRETREWTPRPPRDDQPRDQSQNRDREWTPRPPRDDASPRAEGEPAQGQATGEGGRRETRRERWERRREERNRRFEAEGGPPPSGEDEPFNDDRAPASDPALDPAEAGVPPVATAEPADAEDRPARRARATRPQAEGEADAAPALPGFLTRSTTVEPAEAAAPKRRAPRRKPEAATGGD